MIFLSPTANGRAPHTGNLAFVFDNMELLPGTVGAAPRDLAAAQPPATTMIGMLIAFARTGNPNHPDMLRWPVYDLKERETIFFDRSCKVVSDPRSEEHRMMVRARCRQSGT
jgi:para-nitrobenzyl esterase